MVDRVARGDRLPERYAYGLRALREEIVEEIATGGNEGPALVTRNSYGSLVINAPSVMFIDVDVPEPGALARLGRLFSSKRGGDQQLDTFKEALTAASTSSFRIYRTAAWPSVSLPRKSAWVSCRRRCSQCSGPRRAHAGDRAASARVSRSPTQSRSILGSYFASSPPVSPST